MTRRKVNRICVKSLDRPLSDPFPTPFLDRPLSWTDPFPGPTPFLDRPLSWTDPFLGPTPF
jgi:hypothetical protein